MDESPQHFSDRKTTHSVGRVIRALRNSSAGVRRAIASEVSIREELIAIAILTPVAVLLPVSNVERVILVLSLLQVLLVELLNTAIEATVDRISLERHPLAGQAKDVGSAAVGVAVLMAGVSWAVIAGPLLLAWIRG